MGNSMENENVSSDPSKWFNDNEMKGNISKCNLPKSSGENVHVSIGISEIKNDSCKRLSRVGIKFKRSFENHIYQICAEGRKIIKSPIKYSTPNLSLVIAHYYV